MQRWRLQLRQRVPRAGTVGGFALGLVTAMVITVAAAPPGDGPYRKLDVFAKVLAYVQNNYVEEVGEEQLVYGAIRGMLSTLDPHTLFMEPAEFRSMREDTSGEFGGLGLEIARRESSLVVLAPLDDSPAARAGIQPGDEITAIDGHPTGDLSLTDVSTRLKGPPGTQVRLLLFRTGFAEPREFVLVRDRIRVVSVESRLLDGRIGYVRIKSFQERTDHYLRKALADLRREAGPRFGGLVLDLRNNPGGLLDQGVRVADRFLSAGNIVTTRSRSGRAPDVERATARDTEPGYPMVVLVNAGTASASEIVAGALQDNGRAVVLGSWTFGKGSVQTLIELDDGSGLKLTIARYYTPSGRSIQESGIAPDVLLESGEAEGSREAALPGHITNDRPAEGRPAPVPLAEVLPQPLPESEDLLLSAASAALSDWDRFRGAIDQARARPAARVGQ